MAQQKIVTAHHEAGSGSFRSYTIGFALSVGLTLLAFILVAAHVFTSWTIVGTILLLAIVQLFVQATFFLHLGRDSSQRWNVVVFLFMLIIVLILVVGTLWIMHNLDYNHEQRSAGQINTDIVRDEGYKH